MPEAPRPRSRLAMRLLGVLRKLAPALATLVIGALLLITIYFTLLDWQWVIFLAGVLFAALSALASRTSHAEWTIHRRTAQLAQIKERLAQEAAVRKHAESAYRASAEKMQLLSDAIPAMLLYADAGARVRSHNRAFAEWRGAADAPVDGHPLADVVGQEIFAGMQQYVGKALAGELTPFERSQTIDYRIGSRLQIIYVPHLDALGKAIGLFILMTEAPKDIAWAAPDESMPADEQAAPETAGRPLMAVDAGGQTLYLRSITEQLTGWDNPEARLRQALQNNEFRLFCQQFVDLKNAGVRCPYYEILIRLQEEEANLTPPGAFIPVAEHFNMTTALDCWVVRNVIEWHRSRRRDGPLWETSMYSLNLFSSTLHDTGFVDYVQKLLDTSGVPARVLCFEVAESDAALNRVVAARFVNNLHRTGCRVALCGFGGGTASLDLLKHIRVDFLKIDGSMAHDILDNPVNRAKIKAISRVCSVIGVQTVAQFVESAATLQILTECGVDYAQGFGVARPHAIDLLK
jgi:EAL domain-containing protein (putative c-di-GMP-specific phosphodiesterase class I)/PAS domain-containing protein